MNEALLKSENTLEYVRKRANLPGSPAAQRKELRRITAIKTDGPSNTITVAITATDQAQGQKVARLYIGSLKELGLSIQGSSYTQQAALLEGELKNTTEKLNESEKKLQQFQEKAKSVTRLTAGLGESGPAVADVGPWLTQLRTAQVELASLGTKLSSYNSTLRLATESSVEMPTAIPALVEFRKAAAEAETKLQVLRIAEGDQAPGVIRAQKEVQIARAALKKEIAAYLQSINQNTASEQIAELMARQAQLQGSIAALKPLADAAPKEAREYQELVRDLGIYTNIIARLQERLAYARLAVDDKASPWYVYDDAIVSDRPTNKGIFKVPLLNTVLGTLLGCLVALILAVREIFSQRRRSQ